MRRASYAERTERLNWARSLLRRKQRSGAMRELANRFSISPRQAYRYLEQAQHLRQPIPVSEGKVAFTVKLSKKLVHQIRLYARRSRLSLSELVGQALMAVLRRRRGRG